MTSMTKNQTPVRAGTGKKPAAQEFFGLLSDWKIDTQALKDELR